MKIGLMMAIAMRNQMAGSSFDMRYNIQLRDTGTGLADVHTVIPCGEYLRWLPVEEIPGEIEALKATLDRACGFPEVQPVAKSEMVG